MQTTTRVTPGDDLDTIAEEYADRWRGSDSPAARRLRNDLIGRMMPFAERLACRYHHSGEPADDLQQVAYLGLVKAVDRYDPDRGSFTAFAMTTIVGELRRHFRDHTWGVRVPRRLQELAAEARRAEADLGLESGRPPSEQEVADRCGVGVAALREARLSAGGYRPSSLSLPVGDTGRSLGDLIGSADSSFDQVADYLTVAKLVRRLPPRVSRMLAMRFYEDRTQSEIAEEFGISQMHVSRLLARALAWLREALLSDVVPRWPGNDVDPMDSRIVVSRPGDAGVIEVQVLGEVDRDNADRLRDLLLTALDRVADASRVTVDLSRMPLLDAAGIRVLLAVAEAARVRAITVRLTGMQPFVRRIAEISGLRGLLDPA
jgi:RNA polymerase sigma-B factor